MDNVRNNIVVKTTSVKLKIFKICVNIISFLTFNAVNKNINKDLEINLICRDIEDGVSEILWRSVWIGFEKLRKETRTPRFHTREELKNQFNER